MLNRFPLPMLIAVVFLAATTAAHAHTDAPKRLAVLEFELAQGVKIDRTYFSDLARGAVKKAAPQLFVMTRESTETLLQANGKTLADCTGECEVEIGRNLGADFIISGRITQIGSNFALTVRLFSTADAALLGDEEADGKSLDQLFDEAKGAIGRLVKPLGAVAVAPITPPAATNPATGSPDAVAPRIVEPHAPSPLSAGQTKVESTSGLEFVGLPGGTLVGGNFPGTRVAPFALGRTATTVAAYSRCVAAGACTEPYTSGPYVSPGACNWKTSRKNHPINCVDWNQATAFCHWIGGRLPKTEEREWAASGGEGRTYPWGEQPPRNQLCWNGEGNDLGNGNRKTTCPVGSYPAGRSKQGILDLAGNVEDWLDTDFNEAKELRGGAYNQDVTDFFPASSRFQYTPSHWYGNVGFRCAL